jgi:putative lipase involved disintegration of autophagic bodies
LDYLSVAAKITSVIKSLLAKHPDAKLIVTGSSLGGALATIAGLELQLQTGKVD